MLNQSFRQVFVTNNKALLANGQTVEVLPVGSIGILDAKTYTGVTAPTYAKNKALLFVHGTPDLGDGALMDGNYNSNEYSKLVLGKNIIDWKGTAASRPQSQIITIGWSGDVADTNTISALKGEQRHLFLTLTGNPIDKLFSTQGITRHYIAEYPVATDCEDVCGEVDRIKVANDFASQINSDTQINRFVKAQVISTCDPALDAPTTQIVYKFQLNIADTQDDVALGFVQEQYPTAFVKRIATNGIISTYEIQSTTNTLPDAYSNANVTLLPVCDVCPSGYTTTVGGFVYTVQRQDAGSAGNLTTLKSDYGIASSGETAARVNYESGTSTYVVVSLTEISAAVGVDNLTFVGESRGQCVLTVPSTTIWAGAGTLTQYGKTFTITLGDDECGSDRLAELQAAYPDLVIALVNAAGDCVHSYTTTIYSNPVEIGCAVDLISYVRPPSFEGVQWIGAADVFATDPTTCLAGIKISTAFVNRVTNECTYDYFPYEFDFVFATASTFDPVYNDSPFAHADWIVRQIQGVKFPKGDGGYVREQEKNSLGYQLRTRSYDPVVREQQGYSFQAQSEKYYDEYTLYYEFTVLVGGWGQKETYKYAQVFYFPEGYGKNFETAINGYLASANINLEPVVL